jgi:Peptidase family M28
MKSNYYKNSALSVALLLTFSSFNFAQKEPRVALKPKVETSQVQERNVRAELGFLASDAMQGRGSFSPFEWIAAQYIGSQLEQFGVEPAGEKDADGKVTYLQTVDVAGRSFLQNLKIGNGAGDSFEYTKDIAVVGIADKQLSGEIQKLKFGEQPKAGSFVLVTPAEDEKLDNFQDKIGKFFSDGAKAVFVAETKEAREYWADLSSRKISLSKRNGNFFIVSKDALSKLAEGTKVEFTGEFAEPQKQHTWNAVGKITGSDAKLSPEVILLSAHLDHLGVRPNSAGDDKIFNGADDDASGCVAILELARVLSSGAKPKRTVYFAFFGSEEAGGNGATYFVNNLAFPKENLVANLEFEMIGRPDAKVKPDELWLTGYERSNLGAELARRGAKLVADPHPEENFFQRSDNFTLARQGIIAHTVSSYGLHNDYHQASDEVKLVDFEHLTRAVNSMVTPVRWLVNTDFKPSWNEGKKP